MYPTDDLDFEVCVIKSVSGDKEHGWSMTRDDGWCFFCPATSPVEPKPGDTARFYSRGIGYTVRGLFINEHRVFYRTDAEQREHDRQQAAEKKRERQYDFDKNRAAIDARVAALPEVFQQRLERFRNGNPEFRVEYEGYELFCCEQAIMLADLLKTPDAIKAFHDLPWEQQLAQVPESHRDAFQGHSGNTMGASFRLAYHLLTNEANVVREHGALVPVVGCKEYGCTHS